METEGAVSARERTDGIAVRSISPEEIPAWLLFLKNEIFPEDPYEDVTSIWENDREKNAEGIFAAFGPEGDILGCVKAECRTISMSGIPVFSGIISGAGVRKDCRGQGIAGRLFQACHGYLDLRGAAAAYLYSEPETVAFYRRLGYTECERRPKEGFYRMLRLIRPFEAGEMRITRAEDLTGLMDGKR